MFIVDVNFCIFQFHKIYNPERDAPRSETLVAGLGSVLATYPTDRENVCMSVMTRTLNPAVLLDRAAAPIHTRASPE